MSGSGAPFPNEEDERKPGEGHDPVAQEGDCVDARGVPEQAGYPVGQDGANSIERRPCAEAVCKIAAERCNRNVGEEIGIINGGGVCSCEPQVADHLRQDNAVSDAKGIVNKEIDEDGCKNDPGP